MCGRLDEVVVDGDDRVLHLARLGLRQEEWIGSTITLDMADTPVWLGPLATSPRSGDAYSEALADPARRQLVRLVGDGRNTVMVHRALGRGARRRGRRDQPARARTRFAQDAARRGVDVVIGYGGDGTLNEVATGVAGHRHGARRTPRRSHERLRPHPRHAERPGRRGRAAGPRDSPRGQDPTDRPGPRQRSLLLLPHRRRLRRRRGRRGRAAGVVEALVGHPLFIYAAMRTWLRGYDRNRPHFGGRRTGDEPDVADGYFTIVLNTNPYTYLGNRPFDLSPAATLDRALVAVTFRT